MLHARTRTHYKCDEMSPKKGTWCFQGSITSTMESQNLIASYFLSTLFRAFTSAGLFSPHTIFWFWKMDPFGVKVSKSTGLKVKLKKKGATLFLCDCRGEIKPAFHATVGKMLSVLLQQVWRKQSNLLSGYTVADVNMPITARRSAGDPPPSACNLHLARSSPFE